MEKEKGMWVENVIRREIKLCSGLQALLDPQIMFTGLLLPSLYKNLKYRQQEGNE